MVGEVSFGSNNSFKRITHSSNHESFLKCFLTKDRFDREFNFHRWLSNCGEQNILQMEAFEEKTLCIQYNFVRKTQETEWNSKKIKKCFDFVNRLIRYKIDAKFPPAVGRFRSISDHLKDVEYRFDILLSSQTIDDEFSDFLIRLESLYAISKNRFLKFVSSKNIYLNQKILGILSPSDFGGENILWVNEEPIFFDFEYSGFDCISKLFCDFFYRPNGPRECLSDPSIIAMIDSFGEENLSKVILELRDISSIRWCLIIIRQYEKMKFSKISIKKRLNEFVKGDCKWANMSIF